MTSSIHSITCQYGDQSLVITTGHMARQAAGAVTVQSGDTLVLVTVCGQSSQGAERDFFPLTVNYQEKFYATGKIPGGYLKREARPSERETLTSRLIDRPIRPLFEDGFVDDVQIIATVLSTDGENDPDILAMAGASAALALSGMPFKGPIAAARVGYANGQYQLNPTRTQLQDSSLDLVVAGTEQAVIMVESQADTLSEEVMLGAVMFGHQQMQTVIEAIRALAAKVQPEAWVWSPAPQATDAMRQAIDAVARPEVERVLAIPTKVQRSRAVKTMMHAMKTQFATGEADAPSAAMVADVVKSIESEVMRRQILDDRQRIDGRDLTTVRPIEAQVGVIPRAHGSALFTRGETQALAALTLSGSPRDGQMIDGVFGGEQNDTFMLHYNFPPFSVGETSFLSGPKRREIGHGALAKRALMAVLPDQVTAFPYVMRLVSEVLESNGSSSMATVCGGCLALMDAGVPVKAPVAGIAMGLVKDGERFAVLSDILGDEDHLGDMDFKVAGTREGITALQMDIKIDGITEAIMKQALEQANAGRLHILDVMSSALSAPRDDVSPHAPRMITLKINPDKIRDVIGRGGATIREITETYVVDIDINDDGTIRISGVDQTATDGAREHIKQLTAQVEVGHYYQGPITKILDFGAFVNVLPGQDAFLHISQIVEERVHDIHDYLEDGQVVNVKAIELDKQGRVRVSMKGVNQDGPLPDNA